MEQPSAQADFRVRLTNALACAFKDYCSAVSDMTELSLLDRPPSPEQIERAAEAKLRLENARTLLELHSGRQQDGSSAPTPRRRIH